MHARLFKATMVIWATNKSLLTVWNILVWALNQAHTQSESAMAFKKKKKSETLHAKHGGLFRCQEVCVMVIGQMREEGWNRPLCFEDSPSPPRPVQLHHSHPTPKPRNRRDQRDLTFMCTCLCMHLFFVCYTFPGLWIYAAIAVLYGCKWTTKKSTHRRCLVFSKQQKKKNLFTGGWIATLV